MLNALKQDWPLLCIYFAASYVLTSANVNPPDWQFFAIFVLFVLHGYWIRSSEFSAHYETHIANCERCEKTMFTKQQIEDAIKRQFDQPLKPPFSVTSTPADTNQHDAKPPSP